MDAPFSSAQVPFVGLLQMPPITIVPPASPIAPRPTRCGRNPAAWPLLPAGR
jgi:hypothetical protein